MSHYGLPNSYVKEPIRAILSPGQAVNFRFLWITYTSRPLVKQGITLPSEIASLRQAPIAMTRNKDLLSVGDSSWQGRYFSPNSSDRIDKKGFRRKAEQ